MQRGGIYFSYSYQVKSNTQFIWTCRIMNNGTVSKSNQLERGKKTGETFESANIDQELTKMRLMTAKFMKDICIIFHVIGQNCNENFKLLTCCFCC